VKQIKILFCTTEYITEKNSGGLAIFTKKITDLLSKEGILCSILIPSDKEEIILEEKKIIYKVKVLTVFTKIMRRLNKNLFYIIQSNIINKYFEKKLKNQYDLIHFTNYQLLPFFFRNKIPTICRISSLESLWNKSSFKNKINIYLEKLILLKMNLILSPSTFISNELKKNYNLNSFYIPQIFKRTIYKKKKFKKNYILTFGSISHGKGADTILKNINQILKLQKNLYFIWIGQIDKAYKKNEFIFQRELKNASNSEKIIIKSKISQKKLMNYIYNASLILFPSLRDNSPNSCLEAMSEKKIVIARSNAGFDDLITHGKNGFLFNEKNLIQTIQMALNLDINKKKKIMERASKTIEIKFSENNFFIKYRKYIKKLLFSKPQKKNL
jgi:glycosyltransferase involved in cell wall biosynthesis